MASLLIIIPYNSLGSPAQNDSRWQAFAEVFQEYKQRTGITTTVKTVEEIYDTCTGVDEQEKIKRGIYNWALANVLADPDEFLGVMLVGDDSIFPARRILRGYTPRGDQFLKEDCTVWDQAYRLSACDAYYSCLWHVDDPARSFDRWNSDSDQYYGEYYYSNARGVDGTGIHPQVALGRVLCDTPDEFLSYMIKVVKYEVSVESHPSKEKVFLISAVDLDDAIESNNGLKTLLGDDYAVTHFQSRNALPFRADLPSGISLAIIQPDRFISTHIDGEQPRLIHYYAHGSPNSWASFWFNGARAHLLNNSDLPAIVFADSCSTAQYITEWQGPGLPTGPTVPVSQPNIAKAFQNNANGGAVVYIGGFSGSTLVLFDWAKPFFQNIKDGAAFAGAAWLKGFESFVESNDYDNYTSAPRIRRQRCARWGYKRYDSSSYNNFYQVFNMHFFGDPTLHLNGVSLEGVPVIHTSVHMNNWVNLEVLTRHLGGEPYRHEVELIAVYPDDPSILLADTTFYRYRLDNRYDHWSAIQTGNRFSIPIDLRMDMEGTVSEIEYWSVDRALREEEHHIATIQYDFHPPQTIFSVGGREFMPAEEVIHIEDFRITLEGRDEQSGVAIIHYRENGGPWQSDIGSSWHTTYEPCLYAETVHLVYYAEDVAGNIEAENEITFVTRTRAGSFANPLCNRFIREANRGIFDAPPPALQDTVFFEELEAAIDWPFPDPHPDVHIEYAGPVQSLPEPAEWKTIGKAIHNNSRGSHQILWDTRRLGIDNGLFWIRAASQIPQSRSLQPVPSVAGKARLVLINNYLPGDDYTLSAKVDSIALKPGQKVRFTVHFQNLNLGNLIHARIGLVTNRNIWTEKSEKAFVTSVQNLKQGEEWEGTFELTLNRMGQNTGNLQVHTFAQSDEIIYLQGQKLAFTILPRDVSVKGNVRDVKGKPVPATLQLQQNNQVWKVKTNKKGAFIFKNVPAGPYALSVLKGAAGLRLALPSRQAYYFKAEGRDVHRNFTFAPALEKPPFIHPLFTWQQALQHGLFYGLVHGDKFGDSVANVELALEDKGTSKWWNPGGKWTNNQVWFAPQLFVPLSGFLEQQIDIALAPVPSHIREYERDLLNKWNAKFGSDRDVRVWLYPPEQAAALDKGWKVLHIRAVNQAGFTAQTEVYGTFVHAAFQAIQDVEAEPLVVQFYAESKDAVLAYEWDFGDSLRDVGPNPVHKYAKAGTYSVQLYVTGPYNSDVTSHVVRIKQAPKIMVKPVEEYEHADI